MIARYAITATVGGAALFGSGMVTQPDAATPTQTISVRPGIGIGPVNIGETLGALESRFPHLTLRRGELFSLRLDGKTISGGLTNNRATAVHSTSSNLVLGARYLENHRADERQRLVNAGWKMSTCIPNHPLVYKRDPVNGRYTAIAWTAGAPPIALIQPRISSTWTHCSAPSPD